jgi:hypothetical protein
MAYLVVARDSIQRTPRAKYLGNTQVVLDPLDDIGDDDL